MQQSVFPPKTLSHMRVIMLQLEQGEIELPMGRKSRNALAMLLDNPKVASMKSISELAAILTVSPASLTRLSRLLGFSSFKDFQLVFRSEVLGTSEYYSQQVRTSMAKEGSVDQIFAEAEENLKTFRKHLDYHSLSNITKAINTAQRVHCFGYRQTFSLASFLCYGLGMIRQGVQLLNTSGQGLAFALGQINKTDLLIGFGFHPYSSRTVKMMQLASQMNLPMVVLTDLMGSPIAGLGKSVMIVPVKSSFYSNSMVCATLAIEIVLSEVARLMGDSALQQLEERERLISQLNDEY